MVNFFIPSLSLRSSATLDLNSTEQVYPVSHIESPSATTDAMSLPHLPIELQDLIITGLHPAAALALSNTNHFYHSVVSFDHLDPDMVSRFLYELENRPNNLNKGFYHRKFACYICLSLKPVLQFASLGSTSFDGRKAHHRQCVQCDVRDGSVTPGDPYRR